MSESIPFSHIVHGERFKFDGDTFMKTGRQVAWQIKEGMLYKEWAFLGDELCETTP